MHGNEEIRRLTECREGTSRWKSWGPYLSERAWGTVREDYSGDGTAWDYLSHDHARSKAYRWGEDGLAGISDDQQRLCFAVALWNGRDPILKERLFGLTGPEGNHGEDVKECWWYLDSTPTHSYCKGLYRYPLDEFPYQRLIEENARRGRAVGEFELEDSGVFAHNRFVDVTAEYAKAGADDVCIQLTVVNRSSTPATIDLLPTLWFRNTWSWGNSGEGATSKPKLWRDSDGLVSTRHPTLGDFRFAAGAPAGLPAPTLLFTENESNLRRLYGVDNHSPFVKDAFHRYLIANEAHAVNPAGVGTKVAAHYRLSLGAGATVVVPLRLRAAATQIESARAKPAKPANSEWFGPEFAATLTARQAEADEFYATVVPPAASPEQREVARRAYAGMLWSKQFYHYVVKDWLDGDPSQPPPPASRRNGRNADWPHLFNRDVISMPDKWEYPWYAAWDLAFHTIPLARVDPHFAKEQLMLFLREWYMHPNGQLPAYEFALGDVNPPVHAWAAWRVYRMTATYHPNGETRDGDTGFLERVFQKLLINFTWWVNRKDVHGKHLFAGGFLGLDNIGVFDRSKPLPSGTSLEQADGTAWMAFYAGRMLTIALELAKTNPVYEDIASKFLEHFVEIADAINTLGGDGLWDEQDGFYYDKLRCGGQSQPLRIRSLVGVIPLFAVEILDAQVLERFTGFSKRLRWFLENRKDLVRFISYIETSGDPGNQRRLLAIPSKERLCRVLAHVLDEEQFLSPHGVRSLSRMHRERPFVFTSEGTEYRVGYDPGESSTGLFGGNSNWRGPVWFPLNYLLIESLERYVAFYGRDFTIECPTGSGRFLTLGEVAHELSVRLGGLFLRGADGRRPCDGADPRRRDDPLWRDLQLFHEYFHGDDGRGLGASHQTGWTGLAALCLERMGDVGAQRIFKRRPR